MDQHPLDGVLLKLNRAEKHLHAVKDALNDFLKGDLYETFPDYDYKRRPIVRVKNVKRPSPDLSILIGECVYNLRSALDHVAYQLAVLNYRGKPLPRKIAQDSAFPIAKSGPRFRDRAPQALAGVSRSARAAIERLQPYHRRKNPEAYTLLMLEQVSNIDKHRLLHLTAVAPAAISFTVTGSGPGGFSMTAISAVPGSLKENAIVGRVHGEFDPEANVKVDADMAPDVVFDERSEAPSVRGQSVMLTLIAIADFIAFEAMPQLAALFPDTEYGVRAGPEV